MVRAPTTSPASSPLRKSPRRYARIADKVQQAVQKVFKGRRPWNEPEPEPEPDTPCIAYVGNISPKVDEEILMEHFSPCKVLAAKVHCCGGVAMTSMPPPAGYPGNLPVFQYGILTFPSRIDRRKAMTLDLRLDGRKLAVHLAVCQLNEIKAMMNRRTAIRRKQMERMERPNVRRAAECTQVVLKPKAEILRSEGAL